MSHTVPNQHPAVVLRSNYQHLRALLAIAIAVILGLTIAVVVLATSSNRRALPSLATPSAIRANPSAQDGAKPLDHSGRNAIVSMPSSGRPGNHGANVVMLPSKAGHGGAVASALANGTPAVGASAQSLQGLDVGSASATPEPATLLLLGTGIGGVFLARRRSRTSN